MGLIRLPAEVRTIVIREVSGRSARFGHKLINAMYLVSLPQILAPCKKRMAYGALLFLGISS